MTFFSTSLNIAGFPKIFLKNNRTKGKSFREKQYPFSELIVNS